MRTALLLSLLVITGCVSHRRLQNMSAGTTGCRPQAIQIIDTSGGPAARAWTARCNGAVYQCTHVVQGNASCTRSSGGVSGSGGALADQRRQEDLLERLGPNFEFARESDVLRGVRATFDAGHGQLTFFFAPEVSRTEVQVAITPASGSSSAACTELVFAGAGGTLRAGLADARGAFPRTQLIEITQAQPAPVATFCGREWALRRADVAGFARLAEHIEEALADAPASASVAPVGPTSDEAAVRARLDARREALRACAGTPGAVAIEAVWSAGGPLRVHVRGQDDVAVNACVQSALGEPSLTPTSAGRLIHVLEPASSTAPTAPTSLRCRANQVAVPAGGHCQECGPLDGCSSSPATCRPACTRQADCASGEGNCDARVGACVRLCG